ncbi:GNAT family N-acetyltransferase, partial [Kocuria tytonicola]|uniref:GNAT family N-acetyltransferase n=1 Tax=Kocuria tytonicola TaxID=2055946 RepID=UPI000F22B843
MTVPLRTPRLRLRAYDAAADADADFVRDLYSREAVQRYIGDGTQRVRTLGEAREKIRRWQELYSQHPVHGIWLAHTHEGQPVGTVLLKPIPDSGADTARDTEIGWHFHPDAWGLGYATEAARAVLDHAWSSGLTRVVAVTHPENEASQAVCHRLGMTARGLSSAYYDAECALFELTAPLAEPSSGTEHTAPTPAVPSTAPTEARHDAPTTARRGARTMAEHGAAGRSSVCGEGYD